MSVVTYQPNKNKTVRDNEKKRKEVSVSAITTNEAKMDSNIEDLKKHINSVESLLRKDRDKKDSTSVTQLSTIAADLMNQIKDLKTTCPNNAESGISKAESKQTDRYNWGSSNTNTRLKRMSKNINCYN